MFVSKNIIFKMLFVPMMAFTSLALGALPSADQLGTYGTVNAPNTDAEAQAYTSYYNQYIQPYINTHEISVQGNQSPFYKFTNQNSPAQVKVITDPANLTITQDSSVRFYFVNSPAAYNSSIGLTFNNNFSVNPGDKSLIFPNRNLAQGSFVNIPTNLTTAGTILDLYMLADAGLHGGTNPAKNIWWSALSQNIDMMSHVQIAQFVGTPYYLVTFEDVPLSQADLTAHGGYIQNDFTFVMEIVPVPEPSTYCILGSMLAIVLFKAKYKQDNTIPA